MSAPTIGDLLRPHNKLQSGYYWVKASRKSTPEIAYLAPNKNWFWTGTIQSFVPVEIIKRVEQ